MRLIDADAYLKKVCTYNETGCGSCRLQTKCPVDEPTVDAVPVIRCKDCKHTEYEDDGEIICTFWDFCDCNHHVLKNGFCDRAERKERQLQVGCKLVASLLQVERKEE